MKNRRIIINATNIGKKLHGISVYSLNLLKEFAKLNTKTKFLVIVNDYAKQYLDKIIFPQNFSIKYVTNLMSSDFRFIGLSLRLLYSNLLSIKYRDSLIFNTSQLESIFIPCRQVITVHDIIPLLFKKFHKKHYIYFKYFLKFAFKNVSAIITPSSHTKSLLEDFYNIPSEKIYVVHNGIQDDYLNEKKDFIHNKGNYILYCGRIAPTKNITGLIKAFNMIKEKLDYKLIIVGGGYEKLINEIASLGLLNDKIIFKGYIDNDEMVNLYKKASCFVFPSLYEGFGFPPLEAMACGCPVVVSNVSSLPEICGNAAYYIDPNNVESIADGICKVLTDANLRKTLIQNGLERVKLFTWENTAKEIMKVFEKVQ
ncbi:MAG: glycosyltransferase family 1 protein [Candidatus Firestonebacteria bacterium]